MPETLGKGVKKRNKKRTRNYSPKKLEKTLDKIKNKTMTTCEASNLYNIPRTTLTNKASGIRPEKSGRPDPQPMLGKNEQLLEDWIRACAKRGIPLTKDGLLYSANKLLQEGHGTLVHSFDPNKGPGRRWYNSFMERHPNLALCAPEYLRKGQASVSEEVIRKWFRNLSTFV